MYGMCGARHRKISPIIGQLARSACSQLLHVLAIYRQLAKVVHQQSVKHRSSLQLIL